MAEKVSGFAEETVKVGGTSLIVLKGGSGKPLLVLHEELGFPGWLRWNAEMAKTRRLLVPMHPGFGRTERAEWISSVRDLAGFYARYLREQQLSGIDVIGFSFGGWIAAEMAANDPKLFRRMVLVAPTGIRPPSGELRDMFVTTARVYLSATVRNPAATAEFGALFGGEETPEQFEAFEDARAEVARLAWQPYMHNPSLPHLLEGVTGLPTLLIWGREDGVVPLSAGEVYQRALKDSRLIVFDDCGHRPEGEKTSEFVARVNEFLA